MTIKCPYCSQLSRSTTACENCHQIFPWTPAIDEIKNTIKERETSRLRATATLIEEAIASYNGGPRVSLAAIKGFITSLIFPRAIIVLGSLFGVALLAMQTYILYSQTTLLNQQAMAARTEQEDRLRERISKIASIFSWINETRRPNLDGNGEWKSFSPCTTEKCVEKGELLYAFIPPLTPSSAETKAHYTVRGLVNRPVLNQLLFSSFGLPETDKGSNLRKEKETLREINKYFLNLSATECLSPLDDISNFNSYAEIRLRLKEAFDADPEPSRAFVRIFHEIGEDWRKKSISVKGMRYTRFIEGMDQIDREINDSWGRIYESCSRAQKSAREQLIQLQNKEK